MQSILNSLVPSKKSIYAFLALVAVFLMIYPSIFDEKIFLGGDNCGYYILADGLSSGQGYSMVNTIDASPANHFPPGFSFLLSLFMRIGVESLVALKIVNGLLFFLVSLVFYKVVYLLTKRQVLSIVLGVFVLLNVHLLTYSTVLMSEISYSLFQLLTIYFWIRWYRQKYPLKSWLFPAMAICMILSIYIRTMGVTLLGASLVHILLIHRKYLIGIILFTFVGLALLPWQIRSQNLGGNSYMRQLMRVKPYDPASEQIGLGDIGNRVKLNAWRYTSKEIPNSVFPNVVPQYRNPQTGDWIKSPTKHWILGIVIIVLGLLGIWSDPKYRWMFLLIFGGNFAIFLVWPEVWFGIRFILPLIPFMQLFGILGIYFLLTKLVPKQTKLINSPVFALSFGLLLIPQISSIQQLQEKKDADYPPNWGNFIRMAEWAGENLEDAVISSRKPQIFYVAGNQKTTNFRYTSDRGAILKRFDEQKVTHVVMEQLGFSQTGRYLYPLISSDPEKFKLVRALGDSKRKDKNGKPIPSRIGVWLFSYNPEFGYQGEFVDGRRNGTAEYRHHNGNVMKGTWKNDTLQGPGTYIEASGKTHEGFWDKGKKHGRFIITDPGKVKLEAFWNHDTISPQAFILDENNNRIRPIKVR